jgi:hypothetical protein
MRVHPSRNDVSLLASRSARPSSALRAPSPRMRGEGIDAAKCLGHSPRPACGERVPKAGEGPTVPRTSSSRHASSGAMQAALPWRRSFIRTCDISARPSSALRAPSPRVRGEGIDAAKCLGHSPRPACGERVPKAGEEPTVPRTSSSRPASSVAMLDGSPWKHSVIRANTFSARPSSARWAPSPRMRGEGNNAGPGRVDCRSITSSAALPNQRDSIARLSGEMTKKVSPTTDQQGALPEKFSPCTQLISELTRKISPVSELKAESTKKISPASEFKAEMTKKIASTPNQKGACAKLSCETTKKISSMPSQQGAPSKKISSRARLFSSPPEKCSPMTLPASLRTDPDTSPGRATAPGRHRKPGSPRRHPAPTGLSARRDMTTGRIVR